MKKITKTKKQFNYCHKVPSCNTKLSSKIPVILQNNKSRENITLKGRSIEGFI